jgi:RinA family phage transcriptional activator
MTAENKVPHAVWKYVEFELYSYKQNKKELELLRDEIIDGTAYRETCVQVGPGRPAESKALRLITSVSIVQLERTITAIDHALNRLSEDHNNLFERKYIKGQNWQNIVIEMPISRTAYFDLRRDIVTMVALELGLTSI